MMYRTMLGCLAAVVLSVNGAFPVTLIGAEAEASAVDLFSRPLTLPEALRIAEAQNGALAQARKEIEAQTGLALQARVVALPKVRGAGAYQKVDTGAIDPFFPGFPRANDQSWNLGVQVVQPIYQGGRIQAGLRTSKLLKDHALRQFETALADTVLAVRLAFADALLARENIVVQEASVSLLTRELEDTKRRFEAGTVPQFNVLRAETELGNARPRLIRARNAQRTAKQTLLNLLGQHMPPGMAEEIPLQLSGSLETPETVIDLSQVLVEALDKRSELAALRIARSLRTEDVTASKSGMLPRVELFTGYGGRSTQFDHDLGNVLSGWQAGAQASWDIWDGGLTRGKVKESQARLDQSAIALDEGTRRVELEVRNAFSALNEARELLRSQKQVTATAEEALRLASSRAEAGAATQLDVLNAQTALTEARTIFVQAQRDYSTALSRLERATGRLVPAAAR